MENCSSLPVGREKLFLSGAISIGTVKNSILLLADKTCYNNILATSVKQIFVSFRDFERLLKDWID